MKRTLLILTAVSLALVAAAKSAQAQNSPPKVIQIFREDVKPGRGAAHEKVEIGYVRAFQKHNWQTMSIAMTPVAGASDAWFMSGYGSFEALEKERQTIEKNTALINELDRLDEQDAEFRTGQRSIVAVYREDLSYKPTVDLAQLRYTEIINARVRPGHEQELVDAIKLLKAAYEKAGREVHYAAYQVMAGAPSGTFIVFVPMRSLKEIDSAIDPKNQAAVMSAMGEEDSKKFQKLIGDALLVSESSIYAFSPKMSYVSKEIEARSPDFWGAKQVLAAKTAPARRSVAAKAAPKPATQQSEAKK